MAVGGESFGRLVQPKQIAKKALENYESIKKCPSKVLSWYCSCFASRVDVSELGGFAFGDVLELLGRHAMTIELIGADSKYMSHQCKN